MIVSCDGMSGRRQVCRADKTQFWAHMDEIHSRCYNSTLAPYQCGQALCSGERNRLEIRREQLSNMTSQLFASSLDKISARRTKVHKKKEQNRRARYTVQTDAVWWRENWPKSHAYLYRRNGVVDCDDMQNRPWLSWKFHIASASQQCAEIVLLKTINQI